MSSSLWQHKLKARKHPSGQRTKMGTESPNPGGRLGSIMRLAAPHTDVVSFWLPHVGLSEETQISWPVIRPLYPKLPDPNQWVLKPLKSTDAQGGCSFAGSQLCGIPRFWFSLVERWASWHLHSILWSWASNMSTNQHGLGHYSGVLLLWPQTACFPVQFHIAGALSQWWLVERIYN